MHYDVFFLPLVTPLSRAFLYAPLAAAFFAVVLAILGLFALAAMMPRYGNGDSNSNVASGNRIARNDPRIIQRRKYWTGD